MLRTPNRRRVGRQEAARQERPDRQGDEDQAREDDVGPEAVAAGRRDLDELDDDGEEEVHGHRDEEGGDVGGEHRPVPDLADVDERVGGPELVGHPEDHHHHAEDDEPEGAERGPAPPAPLAEDHRHPDHRGAEEGHAEVVEPPGPARRASGEHHHDERQGGGHHDRAEPEGRPVVEELGHHRGDRIAEAGADGGAHREGGDGPSGLLGGELGPGDGHGHRQQPEARCPGGPGPPPGRRSWWRRPRARSRRSPRRGRTR